MFIIMKLKGGDVVTTEPEKDVGPPRNHGLATLMQHTQY